MICKTFFFTLLHKMRWGSKTSSESLRLSKKITHSMVEKTIKGHRNVKHEGM